jgi:hypothetical protein
MKINTALFCSYCICDLYKCAAMDTSRSIVFCDVLGSTCCMPLMLDIICSILYAMLS